MAACGVIVPFGPACLPMTTPTERAQVYFANALLPATLPTPPRSKTLPLLPTPPCLVLLPASPPKPSRAESDERWDAHKVVKPFLTTSSSSSSSVSSSSPTGSRASSLSLKWKSSSKKQAIISRADAVQCWDAHKKQQPRSDRKLDDDDDRSSTGSNDMELATPPPPRKHAFYTGAAFNIVSPDPGMLPMPSFMLRVA